MFKTYTFKELLKLIPELTRYSLIGTLPFAYMSDEDIVSILDCICSSEFYQNAELHFKQVIGVENPLNETRFLFADIGLLYKLNLV